jgi:hypothetical protein
MFSILISFIIDKIFAKVLIHVLFLPDSIAFSPQDINFAIMRINLQLYLLLFLVSTIPSCNTDEDTIDPVIEYLVPDELVNINLPDTLDVIVKVTDDLKLTKVILNLLDTNKIPCVTPQYFYPNSNELQINTSIVLDDKNMASGTYELQVFASDGENTKFKYRSVTIKAIPLKVGRYIAVTQPLTFKSNVISFSDEFEIDTQFVLYQDYFLSGVNSLWEMFFFVSGEPSYITAYNPHYFVNVWSMVASPPRPFFSDIFVDKELIFGTENGDIGIISEFGDIILRTETYENYKVKHIAADENYIYVAHQSLNGDINRLSVYYRVTGMLLDQRELSVEIAALVPVDGFLMVFTHHGNGFNIKRYYPETFLLVNFCSRDGDSLISVEKITDDHMMLVTNRCIFEYDYPCSFTDFTSEPYDFCRIDVLNNIMFLARDNTLNAYSLESGNLFDQKVFDDKLVDFQILYNK